jgi:hypothetical protein
MNGKSERTDFPVAFSGFSFIRTLPGGGSGAGDPAHDSGLRWIERYPEPRTHTEEDKSPKALQCRFVFRGLGRSGGNQGAPGTEPGYAQSRTETRSALRTPSASRLRPARPSHRASGPAPPSPHTTVPAQAHRAPAESGEGPAGTEGAEGVPPARSGVPPARRGSPARTEGRAGAERSRPRPGLAPGQNRTPKLTR